MTLQHEWRAVVDFLPELQAHNVPPERWNNVTDAIVRLRYVKSAWIDHTCIVEVETETDRATVAARRLESVKCKIRRILYRYRAQ